MVRTTLYVFGSITLTVSDSVLGTYTRDGKPFTVRDSLPGRSAAYRSCGSSGGGMPGSRRARAAFSAADCARPEWCGFADFCGGEACSGEEAQAGTAAQHSSSAVTTRIAVRRRTGEGRVARP